MIVNMPAMITMTMCCYNCNRKRAVNTKRDIPNVSMAVKMPITCGVFSFGVASPTNAKDSDISIAPPIHCKTRATISMLIEK